MPNANNAIDQSFVEQLTTARDILDGLIKASAGGQKVPRVKAASVPSSSDGLPAHIIRLRDSGFLKSPKTSKEVHEKLQPIYSCAADRVAMAMLRLQRRKMLRKAAPVTSGKKKQLAYVW
jgi:hypothetical protein